MRILKLKSRNPKKGRAKMAKKRKKKHHKKVMIISNPRKRRYHSNPVKIHRKRRKNPDMMKGIMEYIKPIGLGALGAVAINKAVSYIPMEAGKTKDFVKLGAGLGIAYFGRKIPLLKWGGIVYTGYQAFNMIIAQVPQLAGEDDQVYGYDEEDQLLGSQVNFGSQVAFAGEIPTDQDFNASFDGF